MRTRSSNGKFARLGLDNSQNFQNFDLPAQEKTEISTNQIPARQTYFTAKANGTTLSIPITGSGWNLLKVAIILIALSPWLYLLFRKQNMETVSRKVTEFFDENFLCPPCEPCETMFQKNETIFPTTPNKKNGF